MAFSPTNGQLRINDGTGQQLPIQTGTFATKAVDMSERRRLSLTVGVFGATGGGFGSSNDAGASGIWPGGPGSVGGFTGVMLVQGTDELGVGLGATGTPQAGAGTQPGQNGYTGALFWNTIPSGSLAITNATNSQLFTFTDVGCQYIRVVFNQSATGATATGTLGGSGTMYLYFTAKKT